MKIILLFLAALASFTVHAQPPSLTVEQTVRHIYQNYKSDATAPYFGETGERAITSARIQQALTLNDNLTLPGNIGWLDYDPVCDCQDFGDLVLESVAITQTDADHADAVVRFRIFKDDKEKTTQTLKMVAVRMLISAPNECRLKGGTRKHIHHRRSEPRPAFSADSQALNTAHLKNRLFQLSKGENQCLSLYLSGSNAFCH